MKVTGIYPLTWQDEIVSSSIGSLYNYGFHVNSIIKKWWPFWNFNLKTYIEIVSSTKMFLMGVHTFNVIIPLLLFIKKWENEKKSDQGKCQDHFMISCSVLITSPSDSVTNNT